MLKFEFPESEDEDVLGSPWLSIPEVAVYLEVSVDLARKLVKQGHFKTRQIPGCQVKVHVDSVEEFDRSVTTPPKR